MILFVKDANRWRNEADWPIPDAKPVRLYMQSSRSRPITSLNDGALAFQPGGSSKAADTVGEFACCAASAAKRDTCVAASGRLAN